MKTKLRIPALLIAAVLLAGVTEFTGYINERGRTYKRIDANNIQTMIWSDGVLDRELGNVAGFEWPKDSGKYAIYASGLWLSCRSGDSIRVSYAEYGSHFRPGYIDYNTQTAYGADDTLYRLYKVSPQYPIGNGDFDSWSVWPVDQGAPWVDVNGNGTYDPPADYPVMKGSQNLFCSFNDGYRDSLQSIRSTPPLRAEVHMYAWAKPDPACADAIHYEWTVINKSRRTWTDFSAGIFSDFDIGSGINDLVGTDSALGLVYGYNGTPTDPVYGSMPPAAGWVVKYADGHTGNRADFASRWRCPFDCPSDSLEMYRVLHGLRANGDRWFDPYSNHQTNFPFSGDPVTQTGWRDSTPGSRYAIIGSVMGNVASLDTAQFNTTVFIKRGSSNLNSITELKNCVSSVINVSQINSSVPEGFKLHQNFPNPFNPTTTIKFDLITSGNVSLKVYDILGREVAVLANEQLRAGSYGRVFEAGDLSSGVYFYTLKAGEIEKTLRMVVVR